MTHWAVRGCLKKVWAGDDFTRKQLEKENESALSQPLPLDREDLLELESVFETYYGKPATRVDE